MSPLSVFCFFFFNDTATTEIYTLSLHDALPISRAMGGAGLVFTEMTDVSPAGRILPGGTGMYKSEHVPAGSEEHTSELQSQSKLVCRLLLAKKKKTQSAPPAPSYPPLITNNLTC